jgi:hypothetical protein
VRRSPSGRMLLEDRQRGRVEASCGRTRRRRVRRVNQPRPVAASRRTGAALRHAGGAAAAVLPLTSARSPGRSGTSNTTMVCRRAAAAARPCRGPRGEAGLSVSTTARSIGGQYPFVLSSQAGDRHDVDDRDVVRSLDHRRRVRAGSGAAAGAPRTTRRRIKPREFSRSGERRGELGASRNYKGIVGASPATTSRHVRAITEVRNPGTGVTRLARRRSSSSAWG